jgi:hypothetical protein
MTRALSIAARSIGLCAALAGHVLSLVCYNQLRYGYIADVGLAAAIISSASSIALACNKGFVSSQGHRLFGFAIDTLAWVSLSTAGALDFTVLFADMYHNRSSYVDDDAVAAKPDTMVLFTIVLALFLA